MRADPDGSARRLRLKLGRDGTSTSAARTRTGSPGGGEASSSWVVASLALCLQPLGPSTHMMMASIPGAPLPDTMPSDALLYAAKKSIGTASTSGGIGAGRCDVLHRANILRRRSGWR